MGTKRIEVAPAAGSKYAVSEMPPLDRNSQATTKKKTKKKKWLIHPKKMARFDVVMVTCLVFTAIVTPAEVAFIDSNEADVMFFLNWVVNLFFICDLVANFFLIYEDETSGQLVVEHPQIVMHYVKGWFLIDFVSVLPFDTVGMLMQSEALQNLKGFRIMKLLRLLKIMRVFRASRILRRWESKLGLSFSMMSLIKFATATIFTSHLAACFWYLAPMISEIADGDVDVSWVTEAGLKDSEWYQKYLTAFYWSVMTMTTVGYGDVPATSSAERCVAIVGMLFGGLFYAYIIGAVCGIVASMDEASTQYHQTVDVLNRYCEEVNLPREMRVELREFFAHSKALIRHKYHQQGVSIAMILILRRRRSCVPNPFIPATHRFAHIKDAFVTAVSLALHMRCIPPTEKVIYPGERTDVMYIIKRGLCARLGRVLGAGRFFGEDMILHNATRGYAVLTLTFVDLYTLTKRSMEGILNSGTKKVVRRAAIRLALRREFIAYAALARLKKNLKNDKGGGMAGFDALTTATDVREYKHKKDKAELLDGSCAFKRGSLDLTATDAASPQGELVGGFGASKCFAPGTAHDCRRMLSRLRTLNNPNALACSPFIARAPPPPSPPAAKSIYLVFFPHSIVDKVVHLTRPTLVGKGMAGKHGTHHATRALQGFGDGDESGQAFAQVVVRRQSATSAHRGTTPSVAPTHTHEHCCRRRIDSKYDNNLSPPNAAAPAAVSSPVPQQSSPEKNATANAMVEFGYWDNSAQQQTSPSGGSQAHAARNRSPTANKPQVRAAVAAAPSPNRRSPSHEGSGPNITKVLRLMRAQHVATTEHQENLSGAARAEIAALRQEVAALHAFVRVMLWRAIAAAAVATCAAIGVAIYASIT